MKRVKAYDYHGGKKKDLAEIKEEKENQEKISKGNIMKILLPLLVFFGCAASVSTEQYVGEYEKQKSLDEIEVTKVDGLKLYDLKFNKELEERYPALAEKRVSMGLVQELQNVISYVGRFNLIEAERDMQVVDYE